MTLGRTHAEIDGFCVSENMQKLMTSGPHLAEPMNHTSKAWASFAMMHKFIQQALTNDCNAVASGGI